MRRYYINLIFLLSILTLVSIWFYIHLHLYVTETVFIGGTLTFWAVWRIIRPLFEWAFGNEKDSWARRVLEKSATTEYLVLSLVPLALLYFTTASIYLVYEGAKPGESIFQVDVLNNQNPFLERLTVTSSDRVAGRPFFLNFSAVDLEYKIVAPIGFRPLKKRLTPWKSTHLRVPRDFERKQLHLLKLVPGLKLYARLPKAEDQPEQKYFLKIEAQGMVYRLDDLRRQIVFTGASEQDFLFMLKNYNKTNTLQELDEYFAKIGVPIAARKQSISTLVGEARQLESSELRSGNEVKITVGKLAKNENLETTTPKHLLTKIYTVTDETEQIVWLEVTN
jgi:hypothetical protein